MFHAPDARLTLQLTLHLSRIQLVTQSRHLCKYALTFLCAITDPHIHLRLLEFFVADHQNIVELGQLSCPNLQTQPFRSQYVVATGPSF